MGTYSVISSISNNANTFTCSGYDTIFVATILPLTPEFEADITLFCPPFTVQMENLTEGNLANATYFWEIITEEGITAHTSTEAAPSFEITDPSTYDVKLTITNHNFCTDSITIENYITAVAAPPPTTITATACDIFIHENETYTASGIYQFNLQNQVGCDSIVTLDLTINPSSHTEITETACDFFIYNNENLTETGIYEYTFQNEYGCDSVVTLDLTINSSSTIEVHETSCDTFFYYNEFYTISGTYQHLYQNQHQCDSTITLHLTINEGSEEEVTVFTCDSFPFNNQMITTTGSYEFTLTTAEGCDSVVTLHATIDLPPTLSLIASDTSICEGEEMLLTIITDAPTFQWNQFPNNSENFQITIPNENQLYTVTAHSHDDPSCYVHDSIHITVEALPNAMFIPSPVFQYIEENDGEVFFSNLTPNEDGYTFEWDFGDTLSLLPINIPQEYSPTHLYSEVGTYTITLTVSTLNECTAIYQEDIQIASRPYIYFPSSFTPNHDGLNDYFKAVGSFSELQSFSIIIFDRWGGMLFQSNSAEEAWDGRGINGEMAPTGSYVYKATIMTASGKTLVYTGNIMLLR